MESLWRMLEAEQHVREHSQCSGPYQWKPQSIEYLKQECQIYEQIWFMYIIIIRHPGWKEVS